MSTKIKRLKLCDRRSRSGIYKTLFSNSTGQALVEFTLIFLLLLVVAWIPADFGLAFYTGQLAQNASREGARIAAADKTLSVGTTSCTMPCGLATGVLKETANRMSSALLPGATITLTLAGGGGCSREVTVGISGQYNYFFYQLFRLLGMTVPNQANLTRSTSMRWEHQC